MTQDRLAFLLHPDLAGPDLSSPSVSPHTLLRDQAVARLRNHIVSGQFPPGSKLVERRVAEWLGISRIPARDALRQLEQEGLVESRSSGRHVIELNEPDIRELYVVRRALERVAVRLAARNACRRNRDALSRCLQELRQAVADQDRSRVIAADVETHWSIWRQAENKHLFHMLNSMIGPIFMFVAHNIDAANWGETLAQHEAMVVAVQAGDEAAAIRGLDRHMDHALEHSIRSFRASQANDRDA